MPKIYSRSCDYCGCNYRSKNRRFCSISCNYKFKSAPRECARCGRSFRIRRSYVHLGRMRFCSRECYLIDQRKRPGFVSDGVWFGLDRNGYFVSHDGKKLHREVWIRERGPIPRGFVVHHIDQDKNNNRIENLAMMSWSRHSSLHGDLRVKPARKKCSEADCVRDARSLGMCMMHYSRALARRRGWWKKPAATVTTRPDAVSVAALGSLKGGPR